MNRTPLETVELAGSPTDIAFALGKKRARVIARRVEFWNRMIARDFKGQKTRRERLERGFLNEALTQAPAYVEEIRAMAQGAGLAFRDLFCLNLTELRVFAEKCTTVIVPFVQDGKSHILLGHNEDWNPRRNDVFILKATLPEVSYTIVAYDGYLPGLSCGQNSHGLIHAINYTRPHDFRIGLPRIFITHKLVTARDFSEMTAWCQKTKRAFGQSIHMVKGARYMNLELSAKLMVKRKPKLPCVHANHFLDANLARLAPAGANSTIRQLAGERVITKGVKSGKLNFDSAKARHLAKHVLFDRSTWPNPIWRDQRDGDGAATLVTALYDTSGGHPLFYRQRPVSKPR